MRWLLLLFTLLTAGQAVAGHDWGGMDLCTLYPEKMPPGMSIEQLPQSDHPGALLMQRYCAQCHNLPGPGRHTAVEWPQVLERMDTLMEVSSRFGALLGRVEVPTQGESLQIQAYLNTNALQPMRHFSGGFREKSYQQHCSGCHALPDPAQHSADEWPMVMARMARNREVMKRAPLSPETQLTILAYLQQASLWDLAGPRPLSAIGSGRAVALAVWPAAGRSC
ncbi:hypothetical protein [Solemya pervernicosa gill symbiont]|uniref:hypothetical protein n=1 Tax=Solemya pervernicosa gill symbiont TaxID=642797 RepID=UPI0009969DC9|nr:hypothetical protein [Solemya pervernicosa gill symbiont]